MKGEIAIPKIEVDGNQMGWNVFDFFYCHLKIQLNSIKFIGLGWYAYKLIDGVYYFKWADKETKISTAYLEALEKDGYQTNRKITSQMIQDTFLE